MQLTLEQAVDWILEHRKGEAFKGMTGQQIGWCIERAVNCGGFAFTLNRQGRLIALICTTPNRVEKTLRVHHLIAIEEGAMRSLIERFVTLFSGYVITAKRRGKEVAYRTNRLVKLLAR